MPLRFNERGTAISPNLLLVVLLVASLLCVVVYTAEGVGGPLHAVQSVVGVVSSPVSAAGTAIKATEDSAQTALENVNADAATLSELREQNEQLRQMVSELEEYRQTAQRLEGIQQLRDSYAIEGITCRVMQVSGEAYNRMVTIDKGSDDGIQAGMPVMGSTGLVGQVSSTTGTNAQVRLLQDPNSGVAVLIQSNRAEGLLKGNIDGLLYLEDVDNDDEVKVGDTVITSGLGGGYFRGLMVGTVVRVESTKGQAIRQIIVAPNDTAAALEEVMVVTAINSEGALAENAQQPAAEGGQEGEQAQGDGSGEAPQEGQEGQEAQEGQEGQGGEAQQEEVAEESSDEYAEEGGEGESEEYGDGE